MMLVAGVERVRNLVSRHPRGHDRDDPDDQRCNAGDEEHDR
jgi:hypothetical protein